MECKTSKTKERKKISMSMKKVGKRIVFSLIVKYCRFCSILQENFIVGFQIKNRKSKTIPLVICMYIKMYMFFSSTPHQKITGFFVNKMPMP